MNVKRKTSALRLINALETPLQSVYFGNALFPIRVGKCSVLLRPNGREFIGGRHLPMLRALTGAQHWATIVAHDLR